MEDYGHGSQFSLRPTSLRRWLSSCFRIWLKQTSLYHHQIRTWRFWSWPIMNFFFFFFLIWSSRLEIYIFIGTKKFEIYQKCHSHDHRFYILFCYLITYKPLSNQLKIRDFFFHCCFVFWVFTIYIVKKRQRQTQLFIYWYISWSMLYCFWLIQYILKY